MSAVSGPLLLSPSDSITNCLLLHNPLPLSRATASLYWLISLYSIHCIFTPLTAAFPPPLLLIPSLQFQLFITPFMVDIDTLTTLRLKPRMAGWIFSLQGSRVLHLHTIQQRHQTDTRIIRKASTHQLCLFHISYPPPHHKSQRSRQAFSINQILRGTLEASRGTFLQ